MAKVPFTKLGLKLNQDIKNIEWNDQNIEVKQYLKINDKLQLISNIMNDTIDEFRFMNPLKIYAYSMIEIVKFYTNITFTEKQLENTPKLFDLIKGTGLVDKVIEAIPEKEYINLMDSINDTIEDFYVYRNSLGGVIESLSSDYSNTKIDILELRDKLLDPNAISTLKDLSAMSGFYEG